MTQPNVTIQAETNTVTAPNVTVKTELDGNTTEAKFVYIYC